MRLGRGLTGVVVIAGSSHLVQADDLARNLVAHLDPRIDRSVRKWRRGLRMPRWKKNCNA